MKDLMLIVGFGAGLVTGALLYKHSQQAKSIVNKGEKAVKEEVEKMKQDVEPKVKQIKKDMKAMSKN